MRKRIVAILAHEKDVHALSVIYYLKKIDHVSVALFNTARFPKEYTVGCSFKKDINQIIIINKDGDRYSFNEIISIWNRRQLHVSVDPEINEAKAMKFAEIEWRWTLDGIWQTADCLIVNNPTMQLAAARKVYQLKIAKNVGFRIPLTRITNNLDDVYEIWDECNGNVIYKVVRGLVNDFTTTKKLEKKDFDDLNSVCLCPVIFQELIEAELDIRVTIIGKKIFAAELTSVELDWRRDGHPPFREHRLPENVEELCLEFMRALGLEYGAIDFRLTPKGEYVFLEINPGGQYLFVEIMTGQKISQAIAEYLAVGKSDLA